MGEHWGGAALLAASPTDAWVTAELPAPAAPTPTSPAGPAPTLPAPTRPQEWRRPPARGSALTFARLPVRLQCEPHRAAAPHAGGCVLACAVAASIVHCTRLWGGRERDAQSPRARATSFPETGHLSSSSGSDPCSCGASRSLMLPSVKWERDAVSVGSMELNRASVCKQQRAVLGQRWLLTGPPPLPVTGAAQARHLNPALPGSGAKPRRAPPGAPRLIPARSA